MASISLQYSTMYVPGTGAEYYYNKITLTDIDASTLSCTRTSGSGNIWPTIVQQNGDYYVRVEVTDSNIDGASDKIAAITVYGGSSNQYTADCTVTQTTTAPYFSEVGGNLGTIDWEGEQKTLSITSTRISSIIRVVRFYNNEYSRLDNLQFTATATADGFDVTFTIPQNDTYNDIPGGIYFVGESDTYTPPVEVFSRTWTMTQAAIPTGTITPSETAVTANSLPWQSTIRYQVNYTTEYMDDDTIYATSSDSWLHPVTSRTQKYFYVNVPSNPNNTERTGTVTLIGTDVAGVQRSATVTFTQVAANEGVGLIVDSTQINVDWNEDPTIRFRSHNVENVEIVISGDTATLTNITPLGDPSYAYSATVDFSNNDTSYPKLSTWYLQGDNTISDSPFGSIITTYNLNFKHKCQPGVISTTTDNIQLSPAGGTSNTVIYSTSRISGAVTASMSGDINGSVSLSGGRVVITYPANTTDNVLTGTITLTGTDANGDTVTKTISLSQRQNYDITITPSTATLNYGVNTVSYNVVLDNITNPLVTFSGDSSFISSSSLNNGVLTVNTTDFSAKTAKTANIIVTGTTPNGGTYSKSVTLIKNGTDGEIIVTPDTYNIRKSASDLEFTYELDGVSSNISITTSGDIDFGTVTTSGTTVTIPYGTNDTGTELTGTVTLTGTDYKGKTITKDVTVTQTITDGWIQVSPNNQIVDTSEQNYATLTVTTSNATFTNVEFGGRTSQIRNYTRDGNTITVYLNPITVAGSFYITATVKGVSTDGVNVSDTATITLYGVDGYIMIYGEEGSYHIYRNRDSHTAESIFSCFGVNITNIASDSNWLRITSITGDGVLPGVYDSYAKVGIAIDSYAGTPTDWDTNRVGKIIATGVDYKGDTVTAEYVVTQYAVDAEMTVAPTETTIEYNEYLDIDVDLVGAAPVPEILVGPLAIGETFTYEWLDEWDDNYLRSNTVRIYLPTNTTYVDRQYTITFKCEPPYLGSTIWRYVYVTQKAKPASITLSPSSYLADKNSGTVVFNITVDGVDQSRLVTMSYPRWITSASFNSDKTRLTVTYSNNPDVETRTGEICVTESTGVIIGCATITQTGVDPEINVSDLIIRYNEGVSNHFIGTKGVGDLTISFSGDVLITDYGMTPTTGGYNLIVQTPDNLTYNILRSTATVTGTVNAGQYLGQTLTKSFAVIKNAKDGVILINPSTQYVRKAGGIVTFNITYGNMDLTTVTTNVGSFNADKSVLTINVGENTNSTSRTININLSGIDNNGGTRTASASIIQYGTDPSIEVGNIGIPNTQRVTTVFVGTNWVDNLSVTFSGDVVIEDYSLTPTVGGYELSITTPDNLEDAPIYSTALFTGSVTTEPGETVTKQVQVIKYGKEGIINANPTSFILKKAGGTVTVNLLYANMDMSTVTASLGTFNADKSQLTYTVAENPNATDRTITITITGTDVNEITRTATITITQYGIDPYISITPSSKTLRNTESTATFSVTAYKVSDLTVSFNGGLEIINYSLVNGTLTVDTADNEELLSIMEIITISGVSDNGETVTATANIIKFGTGGGLIIDPEFTIAGGADGENGMLIIPYITDRIKEETVYAFINGEIDVESVKVIRNGKFIAIEYPHNTSSSSKVSTLTVTCYDEDDVPRVTTSTITQLPSQYTFTIKPPIRWLDYASTSTTGTVKSENMSSVTTFTDFGDMDATTSYDLSLNGTITVTYQANSDESAKWTALSATGISNSGDTVTIGAWYIQNSSRYNDYEFRFLDSSQADITVDGGGGKIYYGIISARLDEIIPYSITGFVLKGYWTNLPSVRYRDGLPYLVVPINIREAVRSIDVSFIQEQSYLSLYAIVHQEEGAEPDVHPIWETSELTSPIGEFIEYHITNDGDIIYAGKAYRYPEEFETIWSVNDIVSNYLGNGIYFTEGIQQIPNYAKDFFIGTSANAKYVKTFYNSWAYEHTNYWLSDPIDNRVDPRQWLPVSFLSTEYPYITIGNRVYAAFKENDGWTVMTHLRGLILDCDAGINAIGINNNMRQYQVSQGDYVLYYSNAYGGWDSLLLTGTAKKTDEIEHLTYKRHPRRRSQFSKINYQNNVTPTWTLKTGITIDGNKMYHLLESTMVYLHNLETNEIIPVVITNSQCEYLTYRNNGKRPYFYTITVEESNTKLRK